MVTGKSSCKMTTAAEKDQIHREQKLPSVSPAPRGGGGEMRSAQLAQLLRSEPTRVGPGEDAASREAKQEARPGGERNRHRCPEEAGRSRVARHWRRRTQHAGLFSSPSAEFWGRRTGG